MNSRTTAILTAIFVSALFSFAFADPSKPSKPGGSTSGPAVPSKPEPKVTISPDGTKVTVEKPCLSDPTKTFKYTLTSEMWKVYTEAPGGRAVLDLDAKDRQNEIEQCPPFNVTVPQTHSDNEGSSSLTPKTISEICGGHKMISPVFYEIKKGIKTVAFIAVGAAQTESKNPGIWTVYVHTIKGKGNLAQVGDFLNLTDANSINVGTLGIEFGQDYLVGEQKYYQVFISNGGSLKVTKVSGDKPVKF